MTFSDEQIVPITASCSAKEWFLESLYTALHQIKILSLWIHNKAVIYFGYFISKLQPIIQVNLSLEQYTNLQRKAVKDDAKEKLNVRDAIYFWMGFLFSAA